MKYSLLVFILIAHAQLCQPSAITYELNGGRLGDNLSTYCKAKWYAHKYNFPLLYKPFTYSEQLALHTQDKLFHADALSEYDAIVKVNSEEDIKKNKDRNVLYVTNFYTQAPGAYEQGFTHQEYGKALKESLTPIIEMEPLEKPEGCITIALHVRKGGGFDAPLASVQIKNKPVTYADHQWPTKFPPDQYYLDQLAMIRTILGPEKKLIIYLFTDDPNPAALAQRYQEHLTDTNLEFRFRAHDNSHDAHVVEDFYRMAQCDCLIRSSSLLARASQLIGNHKIIIHPIQGYWVDGTLVINPVGIIIRN